LQIYSDITNHNPLSLQQLQWFLDKNSIAFSADEFESLLRKYRIPGPNIDFATFVQMLTPEEPYYFPEQLKLEKQQVKDIVMQKAKENKFGLKIPVLFLFFLVFYLFVLLFLLIILFMFLFIFFIYLFLCLFILFICLLMGRLLG
jgi:hypothetical protein